MKPQKVRQNFFSKFLNFSSSCSNHNKPKGTGQVAPIIWSNPHEMSMSTKYCCMLMRVSIDCKGCYKKLRRTLVNMKVLEEWMGCHSYHKRGGGCTQVMLREIDGRFVPSLYDPQVETHVIERQFNRVSVCGRFRPSDVAIRIRKRMNRRVEILEIQEFDEGIPQEQQQQQPLDNQQEQPMHMGNGHAHVA